MKVLLVIDYINAIAGKGTCAKYLGEHPEVVQHTNQLIKLFRSKEWLIFFVRLAFEPDYAELPAYAPNRQTLVENKKFQLASEEVRFIDTLDITSSDRVINKKSGNPFFGSGLLEALQKVEAKEVIFTGVATDNAILFGTNTAMTGGFKPIVVSDACGAATDAAHVSALAIIKRTSADAVVATKELGQVLIDSSVHSPS